MNTTNTNEIKIEVGTRGTMFIGTDRYAVEIVEVVNKSKVVIRNLMAIRTDNLGLSQVQEYRYESNPNGMLHTVTKRRNGTWKVSGTDFMPVSFRRIDHYMDPSF